MIICYKCASFTGRCLKCGKIVKNNIVHDDYGVLVEESYYNNAWGKVYYGTVICNNGEIYEFNGDLDKTNVLKSENVTKIKSIPESDLELIKEYATYVGKKYKSKRTAYDMGSFSLSVYNNDKKTVLSESGDNETENTDKYAIILIEIINIYKKYIPYIYYIFFRVINFNI